MQVFGTRVAPVVVVLLATAAVAIDLAAVVLLQSAVPYLGTLDLALAPSAGAACAVAAAVVALTSRRHVGTGALLVLAVGLAGRALSLGLAPTSSGWVAIGTAEYWLVPGLLWITVICLRGDLSVPARGAVVAASTLALVSTVARSITYDPASWDWCRCATNPLSTGASPATYLAVERWATVAHVVSVLVLIVAVFLHLARRPGRRGWPELGLALAVATAAVSWLAEDLPSLATPTPTNAAMNHAVPVAVLVVLALYLVGSARRRPSRAHVADLLLAAREEPSPERLRELVARALGDPEVVVLWWDAEQECYLDHHGSPTTRAAAASLSASRTMGVESDGRPIALVLAGRELTNEPGVRDAVAEALRLATENRRLSEELATSLAQVRESRARIVAASDEARKRIERDLHDGAQQLIVSTGVKLNLASSQLDPSGAPELAETLAQASDELGRALAELRQLAGGITPTALVHGSLADALEEMALRSSVPTTVVVEGATTVDAQTSATAYFVVAECLTNVGKHAGAATATVAVELGDTVRITVTDDGGGGADPSAGSGLRGLSDRVEARGGTLVVQTGDAGTTVTATVPQTRAGLR